MTKTKIFIIVIVSLIVLLVSVYMYRHFIEFKNSEVKRLINEEASKWSGLEKAAAEITHDACMHILNSRSLTNQVRTIAKQTGVSKERALVDAAVAQAYAYKYFAVQ